MNANAKEKIDESTYFIPECDIEQQRLRILHEVFLPPATRYIREALSRSNAHDLSIADIGCGTGQMTKWMEDNIKNARITAMDLSASQINTARVICKSPNTSFLQFNIIEDNNVEQYDLVYCRFLLHHLPDPKIGLQKLIEMTKSGGSLVIGEPILQGKWCQPECSSYYELYNKLAKKNAEHHWAPDYGNKLLTDLQGFSNVKLIDCEQYRPILRTPEHKAHHSILLEIFKDEFISSGLMTTDEVIEHQEELEKIKISDKYTTDLFGLAIFLIEKL